MFLYLNVLGKNLFQEHTGYLNALAAAEPVTFATGDAPENALSGALNGVQVYLPLKGLIDVEKELARLQKELDGLEKDIKRTEGKLNNENFTKKAPANVVENEREKLSALMEKEKATKERFAALEKMK
ncbi:MAG: hypothetical protein IKN43_07715 [Selenomonadaceae bacterium]|nr:hypothetical protein [Selenomonadaceae bacterium]